MKALRYLILAGFAALMIYGALDLPYRGETDGAMNRETSPTGSPVAANYYVQNAYKDAKTPNIVTVILGDYRAIDTLGEQIVVFTAGLILVLVLSGRRESDEAGAADAGGAPGGKEGSA